MSVTTFVSLSVACPCPVQPQANVRSAMTDRAMNAFQAVFIPFIFVTPTSLQAMPGSPAGVALEAFRRKRPAGYGITSQTPHG